MIYRETFFRPDELHREAWSIPAVIYNRTHHLLNQTKNKCLFVPIRNMQYLAVLDKEEIIFIDSAGGYGHHNGVGGRIIQLAWLDFHPQIRQAISDPVPCHIAYYLPHAKPAMQRLVQDFSLALEQFEQREHKSFLEQVARILPFKKT